MGMRAFAQSSALHATQEEIEIWNQRKLSGPYLDDWNRINSRASSFLTNPNAETWPGNQVNAAWNCVAVFNGQQAPNFFPGRTRGDKLRDAGLVYLMTGNTTYRDAVRNTLLTQASISGTNFSNTTKWPTNYESDGYIQSGCVDYEIVNWLRKLTYGYTYIRASLSAGNQATIDTWLLNAAKFWNTAIHNLVKYRFPNRLSDDYSSVAAPANPGSAKGLTHFGGYRFYSFHYAWNNIPSAYNAFVGAVAVLLDDGTLKAAAKRYVKEWLMFCVASDGTVCDQERWNGATPQTGYLYAGTALGSHITVADHFARAGDTELYTFSTSAGFYGWGGGPKSVLKAMQLFANMTIAERGLGTGVTRYASTTSTTDPATRIGPGTTHSQDIHMAPANIFFKDNTVKTAYMRKQPTSPFSGGYDPWGGDWGTYSGIRFMFGLQEGVVSPYSPDSISLSSPQNLRVVPE